MITTLWKVTGTKSFRLSATKVLDKFGMNLQTYNESLGVHLKSRPGKCFVQTDQAGAEARVVAWDAATPKYHRFKDLFEVGIKPHTYVALQLFLDRFKDKVDVPVSELEAPDPRWLSTQEWWPPLNTRVIKDKEAYALGKRVVHACNYGMKERTFRLNVLKGSHGQINLSADEAARFLAVHKNLFPEVYIWQQEVLAEAKETREIRNLLGYPRRITSKWNSTLERDLLSFRPQSTVGCLTHLAAQEIARNTAFYVALNKHDSIVLEVPEEDKDVAVKHLEEAFQTPVLITRTGVTFQMAVESHYGYNLAYQTEDNPNGLRAF